MKRSATDILANKKMEAKREKAYLRSQRKMSNRVGWLVTTQIVIFGIVSILTIYALRKVFIKKRVQ